MQIFISRDSVRQNKLDKEDNLRNSTGSRSTFEFPSRVNLSQFVLYRPDIGLIKQTLNRTSQCYKVDAVRLYVKLSSLVPTDFVAQKVVEPAVASSITFVSFLNKMYAKSPRIVQSANSYL